MATAVHLSMALGNLTAGRILGLAGEVSATSFALGMALVVLGMGVVALLLRTPVQRLMQAGGGVRRPSASARH